MGYYYKNIWHQVNVFKLKLEKLATFMILVIICIEKCSIIYSTSRADVSYVHCSVSANVLSDSKFEFTGLEEELPTDLVLTEARLYIPVSSAGTEHTMRLTMGSADNTRPASTGSIYRWWGDCKMVDITKWLQVQEV